MLPRHFGLKVDPIKLAHWDATRAEGDESLMSYAGHAYFQQLQNDPAHTPAVQAYARAAMRKHAGRLVDAHAPKAPVQRAAIEAESDEAFAARTEEWRTAKDTLERAGMRAPAPPKQIKGRAAETDANFGKRGVAFERAKERRMRQLYSPEGGAFETRLPEDLDVERLHPVGTAHTAPRLARTRLCCVVGT